MTNRKTLKRQYLETKTRAGVYAIRNQAMEIRGAKLDEHESLRGLPVPRRLAPCQATCLTGLGLCFTHYFSCGSAT